MVTRVFLFAALMMASGGCAAKLFTGNVTHVTDGDTLWVQPDTGGPPLKLRIDGIDAPEICQVGGEASHQVLSLHALHHRVTVMVKHHDIYGRGLARIQLNGHDLGAQMVRAGHAWSYRWQRSRGPYAVEEAAARQSRLGLFAVARAEMPRDFRKRHGSCHITPE
jgi:endonuclease YncB( thermonuclease family)